MVNDIFMAIKAICTPVSLDVTRIEVRRSSVLLDGLKDVGKPKFKPCHTLKVFVVIHIIDIALIYMYMCRISKVQN